MTCVSSVDYMCVILKIAVVVELAVVAIEVVVELAVVVAAAAAVVVVVVTDNRQQGFELQYNLNCVTILSRL